MYLNIERASSLMNEAEIDFLVATTPHHVVYTAGFKSLGHWILPGTQVYSVLSREALDNPLLIIPHGELDLVVEQGLESLKLITYGTMFYEVGNQSKYDTTEEKLRKLVCDPSGKALSGLEGLVQAFTDLGATRTNIAVDERGIAPGGIEYLRDKLPGARIQSGYGLIQKIRMVKTQVEIGILRQAAQICERAIYACLAFAKKGMTEIEMACLFKEALIREGAKPFLSVIAFGTHTAFANAIPSNRELKPGDMIRFDVGCEYKNYTSDIARVAVFGEVTTKIANYYNAVLAGQNRAFEMVRSGVKASEVFEAAVAGVREGGIPHYQRHHVGHGVGIEVYDPPLLTPENNIILETGMVIDIETPYYELGFGGVQVEDTIVVKEDGFERLTASPRDLILLPSWGGVK